MAEPVPFSVAELTPFPVAEPAEAWVKKLAPSASSGTGIVAQPAPFPVVEPAPFPVAELAPFPVAEPAEAIKV